VKERRKVFDYGAVEFVNNGRSSREKEDSFSLDENDLLLIGMKFSDLPLGLTGIFFHFCKFFMVFGDFK